MYGKILPEDKTFFGGIKHTQSSFLFIFSQPFFFSAEYYYFTLISSNYVDIRFPNIGTQWNPRMALS